MKYSGASSISSSGRIDVAASARRVEVDNRISLKFYYRIADNIMKQADVFRDENNVIDLYIMLLRFSSLVSETIPCHLDYKSSTQTNKNYLRKRLIHALNELENLKPTFEQENNKLAVVKAKSPSKEMWQNTPNHSVEQLLNKSNNNTAHQVGKALSPTVSNFLYNGVPPQSLADPLVEKYNKLSLRYPNPKEETLSRHSILGPNGLLGQWQLPRVENFVRYPNSIDLSPVQLLSLEYTGDNPVRQEVEYTALPKTNSSDMQTQQMEAAESTPLTNDKINSLSEPPSMISLDTELPIRAEIPRQPSPPPVIAEVQSLIPNFPSQTCETQAPPAVSTLEELDRSGTPIELHFSSQLMDAFMKLAKSNTDKNLETCGILAGSLKKRQFLVTALIVPKQESTSDTCHTTNEEEIFEVQDKGSLFPLGWIHTHPTQSCFMSSVDLHTHYSYQTMMPEAIAIVMAPRDCSKKHGIFQLTSPAGMSVIKHCQRRGFHHHDPPLDGNSIYQGSSHVYINPSIAFDVIDLR